MNFLRFELQNKRRQTQFLLLSPAAPTLMPLRQRMGEPTLTFSTQRLVEGWDLHQQEACDPFTSLRPPSGRQNRSRSIGQLDFLPVPSTSLSSSLSHPSICPTLSFCPSSSSSHTEGVACFSALFFHSSHFHSPEAPSGLPPEEGIVTSRKRRCRSGSFGYFPLHGHFQRYSVLTTRRKLVEMLLT